MNAALCALHEVVARSPQPYKNLIPSFVSILKQARAPPRAAVQAHVSQHVVGACIACPKTHGLMAFCLSLCVSRATCKGVLASHGWCFYVRQFMLCPDLRRYSGAGGRAQAAKGVRLPPHAGALHPGLHPLLGSPAHQLQLGVLRALACLL